MSRTTRTIAALIAVVVIVVLLALAYIWFSGGSGAPSATLSAPTLAIATQAPTSRPTAEPTSAATAEVTAEVTTETTPAATTEATTAATAEMATEVATEAPSAATAEASAAGGLVVYNITTDQSKVSFTLTEDLRGQPTTVVGTTDQVAGQIAVDFANPANSQVGEIRIDARTLVTDQEMRNRAIRSAILQSAQDQYEFISFKPTAITGLPASVTLGTAFSFQITGDLTIRDITKSVTFDVTVTPETDKIAGTAKTTVQRSDFELTIPNVPQVANVSEAVDLQIDFVALPASS